ncbi:hypothetical protein ACFE04_008355 [Oxalis oulophora]
MRSSRSGHFVRFSKQALRNPRCGGSLSYKKDARRRYHSQFVDFQPSRTFVRPFARNSLLNVLLKRFFECAQCIHDGDQRANLPAGERLSQPERSAPLQDDGAPGAPTYIREPAQQVTQHRRQYRRQAGGAVVDQRRGPVLNARPSPSHLWARRPCDASSVLRAPPARIGCAAPTAATAVTLAMTSRPATVQRAATAGYASGRICERAPSHTRGPSKKNQRKF